MYFVYVLQGIQKTDIYKGITNNLERRLYQHERGQYIATKKLIPFKLVYVEVCSSRVEARSLEKYFKSGFGREILREIIQSE